MYSHPVGRVLVHAFEVYYVMCPHLHVMYNPANYLTPSHFTLMVSFFSFSDGCVEAWKWRRSAAGPQLFPYSWTGWVDRGMFLLDSLCFVSTLSLSLFLSLTLSSTVRLIQLWNFHVLTLAGWDNDLSTLFSYACIVIVMIVISSVKVDCVMLAQECHGANVGCALLPEFCFTRYWRKNCLVLLLVITSGLLFMKSIYSDLCEIVWLFTIIMWNCMIFFTLTLRLFTIT